MGDRRDFLKRTAALATAVGVRDLSLSAQARAAMPTPRASAFMAAFGLKYPICNAGMGTAASPETLDVARAVDNLGAEALRLAAAQVRLRRTLDDAFVSMSRRSQSMV